MSWGLGKGIEGADQSGVRGAARVLGNIRAVQDAITIRYKEEGLLGGAKGLVKDALWQDNLGGLSENQQQIGGTFGKLVRMSFSALDWVTNAFQDIHIRGEAYALAADKADAQGLHIGTHEFWDKVAQGGIDPSSLGSDVQAKIEKFAERMTFQEELGTVGKAFSKFAQKVPAVDFLIPFRKASTNVIKQEVRLSPLSMLEGNWRKDFAAGGEARSRALAETTVGTAIAALGFMWAESGKISGSGDPDPKKRALQMQAGWQPHSLQTDDGKWHSFGKFHPTGLLLGMVADIHDIWQYMDKGEQDKATAAIQNAAGQAVRDQPFLMGIQNAAEALQAPAGKGKWTQNFVSGFVPIGGTLSAAAAAMDPYKREVDGIKDAVMNKIPGLRQELMPQRDSFGNPIPEAERGLGMSPIKTTEPSTDKVYTEAARLATIGEGLAGRKEPKSIQLPSLGQHELGKVELTPEQRDMFGSVAGQKAYEIMDRIVNQPTWDDKPPLVQQKIFNMAFEAGHKLAESKVLTPEQRKAEMDRVIAGIHQRLGKE